MHFDMLVKHIPLNSETESITEYFSIKEFGNSFQDFSKIFFCYILQLNFKLTYIHYL